MRYGSVCSGVGSCRLASEGLDWECAFFAEIEAFPSAVLAHRFPEVPNYGDFTQIGESAGPVDILVGGTPCQSFSVAGKRAGLDSPNGNLAIEFARLAQRLRARWIVWENVPGVLSSWSDEGEGVESSDFDSFLTALEDVGYSTSWTVLDAQHFGVPQRRRRVFVVGYLGDWRPPAAVLFEPDSLRGHSAPREDVAGTLGGGAGTRGWSPDTDRMTFVPVTANSLNARDGKGADPGRSVSNDVAHALSSEGADASEGGTGRGTPLVAVTFQPRWYTRDNKTGGQPSGVAEITNAGKGGDSAPVVAYALGSHSGSDGEATNQSHDSGGPVGFGVSEELAYALRGGRTQAVVAEAPIAFMASDYATYQYEQVEQSRPLSTSADRSRSAPIVAFAENQHGELRTSDTMPSLSTAGGKPGSGYPAVATQMSVRRLIPRECEALQGLPRDWTLVPYRGKPASDAPRYRAIGNGWCIPVVRWIFTRLDMVDRILKTRMRRCVVLTV